MKRFIPILIASLALFGCGPDKDDRSADLSNLDAADATEVSPDVDSDVVQDVSNPDGTEIDSKDPDATDADATEADTKLDINETDADTDGDTDADVAMGHGECRVISQSPLTFPLDGGSHTITIEVLCDEPTRVVTDNWRVDGADISIEEGLDGVFSVAVVVGSGKELKAPTDLIFTGDDFIQGVTPQPVRYAIPDDEIGSELADTLIERSIGAVGSTQRCEPVLIKAQDQLYLVEVLDIETGTVSIRAKDIERTNVVEAVLTMPAADAMSECFVRVVESGPDHHALYVAYATGGELAVGSVVLDGSMAQVSDVVASTSGANVQQLVDLLPGFEGISHGTANESPTGRLLYVSGNDGGTIRTGLAFTEASSSVVMDEGGTSTFGNATYADVVAGNASIGLLTTEPKAPRGLTGLDKVRGWSATQNQTGDHLTLASADLTPGAFGTVVETASIGTSGPIIIENIGIFTVYDATNDGDTDWLIFVPEVGENPQLKGFGALSNATSDRDVVPFNLPTLALANANRGGGHGVCRYGQCFCSVVYDPDGSTPPAFVYNGTVSLNRFTAGAADMLVYAQLDQHLEVGVDPTFTVESVGLADVEANDVAPLAMAQIETYSGGFRVRAPSTEVGAPILAQRTGKNASFGTLLTVDAIVDTNQDLVGQLQVNGLPKRTFPIGVGRPHPRALLSANGGSDGIVWTDANGNPGFCGGYYPTADLTDWVGVKTNETGNWECFPLSAGHRLGQTDDLADEKYIFALVNVDTSEVKLSTTHGQAFADGTVMLRGSNSLGATGFAAAEAANIDVSGPGKVGRLASAYFTTTTGYQGGLAVGDGLVRAAFAPDGKDTNPVALAGHSTNLNAESRDAATTTSSPYVVALVEAKGEVCPLQLKRFVFAANGSKLIEDTSFTWTQASSKTCDDLPWPIGSADIYGTGGQQVLLGIRGSEGTRVQVMRDHCRFDSPSNNFVCEDPCLSDKGDPICGNTDHFMTVPPTPFTQTANTQLSDTNGDGFDDIIFPTGRGNLVILSNGEGGAIGDAALSLPGLGGVDGAGTPVGPGQTGSFDPAYAGFGKGTKNTTSQASAKPQLL